MVGKNLVVTSKARNEVNRYLKKFKKECHVLGMKLLEKRLED